MKHKRDDKEYTSKDNTDLGTYFLGVGQVRDVEVRDEETGDSERVVGTGGYEKAVEEAIRRLQDREDDDR